MYRFAGIFILFLLGSLFLINVYSSHAFIGDDVKNIVNRTIVSGQITYIDPLFNKQSNNFQAGEMIYVRIETPSKGTKERRIEVLDDNKKVIQKLNPAIQSFENQLIYTASTTIDNPGTYYLDVLLKDESNSFSMQQNIEIQGNTDSDSVSYTDGGNSDAVKLNNNEEHKVPEENKYTATESGENIGAKTQSNSIISTVVLYIQNIINNLLEKLINNPLTR